MLLAIDVGNTGITFGVFDNKKLVTSFSLQTDKKTDTKKFSSLLVKNLSGKSINPSDINSVIFSSVVPELKDILSNTVNNLFGVNPLEVSHNTKINMPILYEFPEEVGADRIVNAVAAYSIYKKSTIVVDFGTATTFDCISHLGEYMGGAIAPGIKISTDALSMHASKLPKITIEKPANIIGKNTVESMQAGIFYGYVSLVDGLIKKIKKSMPTDTVVISTGGFSKIISDESQMIKHSDEFLTLKGLRKIFELNE